MLTDNNPPDTEQPYDPFDSFVAMEEIERTVREIATGIIAYAIEKSGRTTPPLDLVHNTGDRIVLAIRERVAAQWEFLTGQKSDGSTES